MRGVYYRTEKDGTPLATPELRISATNNRTVYYDNQNAKEAALQNDEIKEGSIVLTGYADGESEVLMKENVDWVNKVDLTVAQLSSGYAAPADGIVCISGHPGSDARGYVSINSIQVSSGLAGSSGYRECQTQIQVNEGDVVRTVDGNGNAQTWTFHSTPIFVPFKTVAEPLTLPVNVNANPAVPDYSRAVAIDVSTMHTTGYTVPADGYLVGNFWSSANTAVNYIYVSGNIVAVSTWTSGGGHMRGMLQCPVAKNNIITCDAALNTSSSIKFVPFKN